MPFNNAQIAPPPLTDPWVDEEGRPDSNLINWFLITLLPAIALSPSLAANGTPPISLTNQNAAIASTPIPVGNLSAGLYRVSTWLRITSPDGVSSSVTPQISYPSSGVTCEEDGDAMTSDAINEPKSHTFIANVDAPGPISFSTLYASNTPNAATYDAVVTVERVQ